MRAKISPDQTKDKVIDHRFAEGPLEAVRARRELAEKYEDLLRDRRYKIVIAMATVEFTDMTVDVYCVAVVRENDKVFRVFPSSEAFASDPIAQFTTLDEAADFTLNYGGIVRQGWASPKDRVFIIS